MLSKLKIIAIAIVSTSDLAQGIELNEVDDTLKLAGGFFNGYGWTSLGNEILDFDKGLDCARNLMSTFETSVTELENEYNNSPCEQ